MSNITATCINNEEYEWLIDTNKSYQVTSWTDNLVVIRHHQYGDFGLFRNRFSFTPPTKNVQRTLEHGQYRYSIKENS